jgi:hypothetical protein
VTAYGDVRVGWPDEKIRGVLSGEFSSAPEARMFEDEDAQQIWIQTPPGTAPNRIWVMHWGHGGAWTTFEFPVRISTMAAGLVAHKNWLYRLNRMAASDEVRGTPATYPLRASVGLKKEFSALQSLMKAVMISFAAGAAVQVDWTCNGRLSLPLVRVSLADRHIAATDFEIAYLDDEPLWPGGSGEQTARRRCLFRDWTLSNRIEILGSQFTLTGAAIQMTEV